MMAGLHPLDCSSYPDPAILRHKIITCFADIIRHLSGISNMTDELVSRHVFSTDDAERVRNNPTEESRARSLLHLLIKKSDYAIPMFMEALVADNAHVHDMILKARYEHLPLPVSETIAERETLNIFLDACLSRCICEEMMASLDVVKITSFVQYQCTGSGLPHTVTCDDIIEAVSKNFRVTVQRAQQPQSSDQIIGVTWKPEIRDRIVQDVEKLLDKMKLDDDVPAIRMSEPKTVSPIAYNTITLLAEQLHNIISRDVTGAIDFLSKISQSDRAKVVNERIANRTALYKAFVVNSYNLMLYIIEECGGEVDRYVISSTTTEQTTVMAQAACKNKLEVARMLIKHGADVNKSNEKGSPLLPLVLSNLTVVQSEFSFEYTDTIGTSPVIQACWSGNDEMVHLLVAAGANVNQVDRHGRTCLMAAARYPEILAYVLSLCGDVNTQDENENTALHWAVGQNNIKSVRLLLNHRVEVNTGNSLGNTALHVAIINNYMDIVTELLNNGSDMYRRNKHKEDGLLLAIMNDNDEVLDLLISQHKNMASCLDAEL